MILDASIAIVDYLGNNNPYHRVTAASTPLAAAFIFYSITGGLPEIPTNGVTR